MTSLPPISRHDVASKLPFLNTAILLVPPPMSMLAITFESSADIKSAPAPRADKTDSKSGPAVATTKSPAISLSAHSTSLALSFLAVSPVIITAPVCKSLGFILAFRYSPATIAFTFSASILETLSKGVKYISLLYTTSVFTIDIRGTV